tara:strand:+ start:13423 stop:13977 length:555 start_codon:yes stop_codon:yes gene_type:complete
MLKNDSFSFNLGKSRAKTRRERYDLKKSISVNLNLSIATINFSFDDNLAFVIRSAACFGVKNLYVIGSVPSRSFLNAKSGSLYDYVNIKSFSRPSDFLDFCRRNSYDLYSLDLTDSSNSIYKNTFSTENHSVMVLGNESIGIPVEILLNSKHLHIPMPGVGFCLNVSQAGTVAISEFYRKTKTQ